MKKFKYLFLSAFLIESYESFSAEYGYVDDETRIQLVIMNQLMHEYPRQAIRSGIEGSVILKLNVDEYGAVLDPYLVESNPSGIFDRASLKAVRKLIYEPLLFEENAVPVRNVQFTVGFKLQ
jgi:TonB family C-terminal domain